MKITIEIIEEDEEKFDEGILKSLLFQAREKYPNAKIAVTAKDTDISISKVESKGNASLSKNAIEYLASQPNEPYRDWKHV